MPGLGFAGLGLPWGCDAAFPGVPQQFLVLLAPLPAETSGCGRPNGNCNAWLQITNVFCCGTLIKLLFPAGALWCSEWSPPLAPPPSPFRCKSALCSFLIIALHPALGFQRHPGNRVCSGCNLDCTLFVITIATRYNLAVLFKFYEFQCVPHVPVEAGAGKRCRFLRSWKSLGCTRWLKCRAEPWHRNVIILFISISS